VDVQLHELLMNKDRRTTLLLPKPAEPAMLPDAVYPQHPELLDIPDPEEIPEKRKWTAPLVYRCMRGWLFPYMRSRFLPGDFHPIVSYLFTEWKCNLDCHYCWAFDNTVKGMTEDVARRSIDWLHDSGCRVLALMGGEPMLRPQFVHKVVAYAAKKGFWVYVPTNGRLLRPEWIDRLGDAGVASFNLAVDAVDEKPGLPKALNPIRRHFDHLVKRQFRYGYSMFFNINICRNNHEDVKKLTEYAHAHRLATDYHINETPMLEQDDHFKHLYDNPTYIRPEDWRSVDELVDWIIEKNQAGYQMVNSVQRLQEMKAFVRMSSGVDLKQYGWYGDGTGTNGNIAAKLANTPGIEQDASGNLQFVEWNCRAGQNNVIIRTDGTVAPCFPMYGSTFDWGNIDHAKFDQAQLLDMKKSCQRHCFSTLNHNLGYCYNDARVIKWVWKQIITNRMKGGARSFED